MVCTGRCGFTYVENMGGSLEEAGRAWVEWEAHQAGIVSRPELGSVPERALLWWLDLTGCVAMP